MMVKTVWEVYKRDSQECIMFLTQQLAENQTFFDEVDLITKSDVDLLDSEIIELNKGNPLTR
jgi:hypothetical protein